MSRVKNKNWETSIDTFTADFDGHLAGEHLVHRQSIGL